MAALLMAMPATANESYQQIKSNIESGKIDLALERIKREIKHNPDDYRAWFLMGVAYTRGQQFHQAMESFQRVIEIHPMLAEPHNNLAVIYNALGDYRAAARELEASLKKKPGDAVTEENLAELHLKLALEHYRRALKRAPNPALEQRYMRLLKVRDPRISPDLSEKRVLAAIPEAEKKSVQESVHVAKAGKDQLMEVHSPVSNKAAERVREAVEVWRQAWSDRDLGTYFQMYATDFQPPERFASIQLWKQYKKRVIGSQSHIDIELSDLKITVDSSEKRASIIFFQKFRSNSYNGDDAKRLEMKMYSGEWKIVSEDSVL